MAPPLQDGVPRGAYRGVVAIRNAAGARIFLAPTPDVDFSGRFLAHTFLLLRACAAATDAAGSISAAGVDWLAEPAVCPSAGAGSLLTAAFRCLKPLLFCVASPMIVHLFPSAAARYNPDVKQRLDSTGAVIRKRPPVARMGRIQPDRTQQQQLFGAGKGGTGKAPSARQRSQQHPQQHAPANL